MGLVNLPKTNQTGDNEWADVEDNDQAIIDELNGNVDDDNLAGDIAHAKLANIAAGRILMGNASNVPTATAVSGGATISPTGVVTLSMSPASDADSTALTGSYATLSSVTLAAGTWLVTANLFAPISISGSTVFSRFLIAGVTTAYERSALVAALDAYSTSYAFVAVPSVSTVYALQGKVTGGGAATADTQIAAIRIA